VVAIDRAHMVAREGGQAIAKVGIIVAGPNAILHRLDRQIRSRLVEVVRDVVQIGHEGVRTCATDLILQRINQQ